MTGDAVDRIEALFHRALGLPPDERPAFLAGACEPAECSEIESLLSHYEAADAFWEATALEQSAALVNADIERISAAGTVLHERYRLVEPIGRGGMGVVCRAFDERLKRSVAVKILMPGAADDDGRRERFAAEAMTASSLNHPNITTIFDIDEHEGVPFIAMELVEGRTLADVIAEDGPLPAPQLVHLARELAHGIAAAHRAGIVHRDLKPTNVMIGADGSSKILDFGIAKLTRDEAVGADAGTIEGSLGYMSPEQTKGLPADVRSDYFSLGVVLYEAATGSPPFTRDTASETLNAIRNDEPPPIARPLGDVMGRLLQKAPAARFESSDALIEAIEQAPVPARRRTVALVLASMVLVAVGLFYVSTREPPPDTRSTEAHVAFLKARHHFERLTAGEMQKARDYFLEAIEHDPDYAQAYVGLAEAHVVHGGRLLGMDVDEAYPKARALISKALAIDDALADANTVLAGILWEYDRDAAAAENAFRRAIEIDPEYGDTYGVYSTFLTQHERHDEALAALETAQRIKPLSLIIASQTGFAYHFARRYDDAVAAFERAIDLDPNYARAHLGLARTHLAERRFDDAIAAFGTYERTSGTTAAAWIAHTRARAGEAEPARRLLTPEASASPFERSLAAIGLAQHDDAFTWLDETLDEEPRAVAYLSVAPVFDPLRDDPRFASLVTRERTPRR